MKNHTFHIPVMGLCYTVDSPIKVAQYGISSVISLVDDMLIEKLREFYCKKLDIPFQAISDKIEDFRAKRITAYLDLLDKIVKEKFEQLKSSLLEKGGELEKYMELLPDFSSIKQKLNEFINNNNLKDLQNWVQNNLPLGGIDVNIMTKLDTERYKGDEKLPIEHNDAHAALRGFANSNLSSALVLSAGMSPRLYSYIEQFKDFFPDKKGNLKKKIILKVSDYRSALIQGKFLAKKGIWISEYRVESGLNCGGHTFATEGYLLGPILEEFKKNKETLIKETHEVLKRALNGKNLFCPETPYEVKITAQGGVGTAEEHELLMDYYNLDSVGWGTPFLLVPEVVNVDEHTNRQMKDAKEDDLYLSHTSPLGVLFNILRNNSRDVVKQKLIAKGTPGSACTKRFLVSSKEYSEKAMCRSARVYQNIKIKELDEQNLSPQEYKKEYDKIVEPACICLGLSNAALINHKLSDTAEEEGVTVCPGPNLAYFSENYTLKEMVDHIYGRVNIMKRKDRPNLFVKELNIYIDYLKDMIADLKNPIEEKQKKYFISFQKNLNEGIRYYRELFSKLKLMPETISLAEKDFNTLESELNNIDTINI